MQVILGHVGGGYFEQGEATYRDLDPDQSSQIERRFERLDTTPIELTVRDPLHVNVKNWTLKAPMHSSKG